VYSTRIIFLKYLLLSSLSGARRLASDIEKNAKQRMYFEQLGLQQLGSPPGKGERETEEQNALCARRISRESVVGIDFKRIFKGRKVAAVG
jgi:hypothetical protein